MRQTIDEIKNELRNHIPHLERKFRVQKIGIFGSVVKGKDTPQSDIDILVSFSEAPGFFKFIQLEDHLSKILNRKVDLVTEKALKDSVKEDILRETLYV